MSGGARRGSPASSALSLLLLVAPLLAFAPAALASVPRGATALPSPLLAADVDVLAKSSLEHNDRAPFRVFAGDELGAAHVLVFELSYPETRVGGLGLPDEARVGAERSLRLEAPWACDERSPRGATGSGEFRIFDAANAPRSTSAFGWNRLFQGREYIGVVDAYDFRARVLWPELGRFGQEDPLGTVDSANYYQALLGRWASTVDPLGLCPSCAFAAAVAHGDPAAVKIAQYVNAGALVGPVVRDATAFSAVAGPPIVVGAVYAPTAMAAAGPAVARTLLASSLTSMILANPTTLSRTGDLVQGLVVPGPSIAGPAVFPSQAALRLEQSIARGASGEAENALARVGENILESKVGKRNGFDLASYVQTASGKLVVFVDEVKAGLRTAATKSFSALGLGKSGAATLERNFLKALESAQKIDDVAVRDEVVRALQNRDVVLRLSVRSMKTLPDGLLTDLRNAGFSRIIIEEIGKPATSIRK